MSKSIINFASLLLAALVVGTMFGIWLGYNPAGLSATAYVEQQQSAIRALNVIMPLLGGLTVLLTLVSAILARGDRLRLTLLLVAVAGFVVSGVVTRFLNQPINAIVINWSASAPPENWTVLRDTWWQWHVVRTASGVAALACLIAANVFGRKA